jgi:hypothetical protein
MSGLHIEDTNGPQWERKPKREQSNQIALVIAIQNASTLLDQLINIEARSGENDPFLFSPLIVSARFLYDELNALVED